MSDDDDEEDIGLFENGHWEWDDALESLVFISDFSELQEDFSPATPTLIDSIEFKEDLDLLEQLRFKKRFQRRCTENDVICLQDIKDLVFFTAPKAILNPAVINILHLPITERFIRALILYSQYYLQISDEMAKRIMEEHLKVRTPKSEQTELEFRDNLEDLRLLVAKEYSCMIMELEIHRLFKSEMYNIIEHKINTKYQSELSERELFVLFGHCVHRNRMINTYSPLNNEMRCDRDIDYRIMGLGVVKNPRLSYRLRFLECVLTAPEETFEQMKMSLGILGLTRTRFDPMLKEIKIPASTASSASSFRQSMGRLTSASKASRVSTTMRKSAMQQKLYEDIYLPQKYEEEHHLTDQFPTEILPKQHCNEEQRKRWMVYVSSYISKRHKRKKS